LCKFVVILLSSKQRGNAIDGETDQQLVIQCCHLVNTCSMLKQCPLTIASAVISHQWVHQ